MKPPDIIDIVCFMPVILIYAVVELKRGWKMLRHGEYSLNPALQARIWLMKMIRGNQFAEDYQKSLLTDKDAMRLRGIYSLVGSLILLIGSVILILSWII